MHICFISSEYPKSGFPHGGVGTFLQTLSRELVKNGVHVSVVGINYEPKNETEVDQGVCLYRLMGSRVRGIAWAINSRAINKEIIKINKERQIDIIEGAELSLAFLVKIPDVKYVIRLHGGHHFFAEAEKRGINWRKAYQEKISFSKADAFIGVSNYVVNHTSVYLSFNQKRIKVIRYPIDTELFSPDTSIDFEPQKIVFAGTLCAKKGVKELLQAFQIIKSKYSKSKLVLYGRDLTVNGISYIETIKHNNPEWFKGVELMGVVDHKTLPSIYRSAEVCVFPSHMETQGLVAPEAMGSGRPVIFSSTGPGPETIIDKQTGRLCNPYDPEDIAQKIEWVFENKDKIPEIVANAQQFVIENFDLGKCTSQNLKFYENLISEKS